MQITLRECSYEIPAKGRSMEEVFKIPKGMLKSIKRMIKESKSFNDAVEFLIREGKYQEALILLVAIWNTLTLEKK